MSAQKEPEMQLLSDLELAALNGAFSGDGNGAFGLVSALTTGMLVYRWWRRSSASPAVLPSPVAGLRKLPMHERRRAELRAVIGLLPDEQQMVVRLRFLEQRSLEQIAMRTGMSCDEIRTLQYHALLALAGLLKELRIGK